jgi:TonB family protein
VGFALARPVLCRLANQEETMTANPRRLHHLGRIVRAVAGLAVLAPTSVAAQAPSAPAAETPKLEAPRLVDFVEAVYPADVPAQAEPVEVELELLIGVDGKVESAKAPAASGSPFESAAIAAAQKFGFAPAKRDGKPVPARIRYKYVFAPPPPPAPKTGVLEGRVLSPADAPIAGATVVMTMDGAEPRTVTTAADGAFRFDDVAPGAYALAITAPERQAYEGREEIGAGEATTLTVRLSPVPAASEPEVAGAPLEFGATATVAAPPREVTKRTLDADELVRVAGTRGDALRAIELLPGVARPPSGLGFVIIRGSSPTDSDVQLEGASVPRLYHFGGLTSFVQGRLLERIDLYPGNFSARYGRKLGGIIEVALRDPKTDAWHAMADVNVIDASALAEGPVAKNWSVAAAFRRSYIDAWFGALAKSTDLDITAAPVYYDYQLMAAWKPSDADKVRVTVYGSTDDFRIALKKPLDSDTTIRGNLGMGTAYHRVQGQWLHKFNERAEQEISLTTGTLTFNQTLGDLNLDVAEWELLGRAEWRVRLADRLRLLAGIDATVGYGDVTYFGPRLTAWEGDPSQNAPLAGRENVTLNYGVWVERPAAYAELSAQPTRAWLLVAGLRADYYSEIRSGTLDPRLVARYELRPGTTIKAGAGLFSQAPEIPQSLEGIGNPNLGPAHGQHYSAGVEQVWDVAAASVEGFYKRLDDLVVSSTTPDVPLQSSGRGRIWGAELSLKSRLGSRGFGFVSYTYSRSRRNDYGVYWRAFDFDQPHILTASGSYRVGWGFELGGTFRYVSGNPMTPIVGSVYDANYDLYRPVYGQVNSARNPAFHQLDVRIEKLWKRGWGSIALYLDVQNAYNRKNPEGRRYNYDYSQSKSVSGLPIIPSLGLRGEL